MVSLQYGGTGYSVCAATSVHGCLQQPECFSSEERAIHQPRLSVLIYISMGEG